MPVGMKLGGDHNVQRCNQIMSVTGGFQPGLQVFDAPTMTVALPGHDGERYGPFAGLCFEAQHFPDSLHHPEWPSPIITPEHPFAMRTRMTFSLA